jgi:hypothetical protein
MQKFRCFFSGSNYAREAAISGVYCESLVSHAAALRRDKPAETPRRGLHARAAVPLFFTIHSSRFTIHFLIPALSPMFRSWFRAALRLPANRGDNPREKGVVALLRSPLSLRFSPPSPRFPDSLPSVCAPLSLCVLWGSVTLNAFAVRARRMRLRGLVCAFLLCLRGERWEQLRQRSRE